MYSLVREHGGEVKKFGGGGDGGSLGGSDGGSLGGGNGGDGGCGVKGETICAIVRISARTMASSAARAAM